MLGVVAVHVGQYVNLDFLPVGIRNFISSGSWGVQLFFFASAFTLFLSFERRSQEENCPTLNFFIRRFFRIAPMYYLGIVYYLYQISLSSNYLSQSSPVTKLNILFQFLFIHDFNPYFINSLVPGGWSIGVEMTFYLILPILFYKIKSLNQAVTFFILALGINYFIQLLQYIFCFLNIQDIELWNTFFFFSLPSQLAVFAVGICFFFLLKEPFSTINYKRQVWVLFLLLANILFGKSYFVPNYIAVTLLFCLIALFMSKYSFVLLNNPILRVFGKLSYSLYLVHFAVLFWLQKYYIFTMEFNSMVKNLFVYISFYMLVLFISFVVSSIFYNLIEKPFQKLGKTLIVYLDNKWITSSKIIKM